MIHKIKISLCALLVSLTSFSGYAQDCDISIRVVAPEESQLTKSAEDLLVKRVSQASNVENIVVGEGSSFAIIPKLVCLTKDVIPGPPVRYSLDFELTLYLTDVNTGTIFYSETLPLKGVDNSESKAQISALKQLKPNAPQLMALFKKGKQKAIAYYDANGADIIAKAQRLLAMKQFEEAIYTVMAIPNCSKYGDQATEVAIKIFDRYMDEHAEDTDKTNERARRELEEFQRLQDEEAEQEALEEEYHESEEEYEDYEEESYYDESYEEPEYHPAPASYGP